MQPARMPSPVIKIMPWYYTERNQPSRAADLARAIEQEARANGGNE